MKNEPENKESLQAVLDKVFGHSENNNIATLRAKVETVEAPRIRAVKIASNLLHRESLNALEVQLLTALLKFIV
jgi:hypothetical protein